MLHQKYIVIKGAKEHNLKNVSLQFQRNNLVVFTGVSGSGKSSLVFDTIYAEGQRRYVESLSSYARQFLERINKPDVELITGISPAVAIEQKSYTRNPRSTVGTTTEIYDYLRLLFARIGKTYCFICGKQVIKDSVKTVSDWIETQDENGKYLLGFPLHIHENRSVKAEIEFLIRRGFYRFYIQNSIYDFSEEITFNQECNSCDVIVIVDRFKIKKGKVRELLADSIETVFKEGEGRLSVVNIETSEITKFNKFYECCDIRYEEPEPRFFSFNNPFGACPVCQGFGTVSGYDPNLIIPNPHLTLNDGAIAPWRTPKFVDYNTDLIRFAVKNKISIVTPFKDLPEEQVNLIFNGSGNYPGIYGFFKMLEKDSYKMHIAILLNRYKGLTTCNACKGSRLRREALQVKINNFSIHDVVKLPIEKSLEFFKLLKLTEFEKTIADRVLKEIIKRLTFLNDVGLSYLTLDRLSSTLSGGESQRINLATSLGSALMGTLYVLDEPSIGLHPRDNEKLINIIKSLKKLGNTVIVVEHEPAIMKEADLIVDMGPHAGELGGEIVHIGNYESLLNNDNSLTGKYLSKKLTINPPVYNDRPYSSNLEIIGAYQNNLKNINVSIPLNQFVVITGVSGSGKSTLVHDIIYGGLARIFGDNPNKVGKFTEISGYNLLDGVEIIDQNPIGKSPRSNPISYVKGFDEIRELFSQTPLARSRFYTPGNFSFNVDGGRCDVCQGEGFIKVEMQFLADIYLECDECKGTRYKKDIKEVTYNYKNIVDVLNMTVDEAIDFFHLHPKILKYLKPLSEVGLGYIKLGQPANTLSGGEAQRVKLASFLNNVNLKQHRLFIFDEPTTGLHFDDINKLLTAFKMLLEKGQSILIIEHNLDVIKCAEHIIDMGLEGGEKGGEIIFTGTVKELLNHPTSYTGKYLKQYLEVH
ncbi:MAG TPA: excinuclease ABC subunit UvrA [Melioribacteraceae bacterium]|nr:excinuclease ABC subunit UvrA [Melioribacteraceae bacterium]